MKNQENTNFAFLILGVFLLPGCFIVIPGTMSFVKAVFPRTDQKHETNEVIIVVGIISGTGRPLTPEGGVEVSSHYRRRYYFTDHHVRRREMPFLRRDDSDYQWETWDLFAPVEGTNCWIRVKGSADRHSKVTNSLVLTVFDPRKSFYKQTVKTVDLPNTNFVHFEDGNKVVTYKSEHDNFTYRVLDNSLEKQK